MEDRIKKFYEKMINMRVDALEELVETEEGPEEVDRAKSICKKLDEVRELIFGSDNFETIVRHLYSSVATLLQPIPNTDKAEMLRNVARLLDKIGDGKT